MYDPTVVSQGTYYERPPGKQYESTRTESNAESGDGGRRGTSSLAHSIGHPAPTLSRGDASSIALIGAPKGSKRRISILDLLATNQGFYHFYRTYRLKKERSFVDQKTRTVMFRIPIKYDEKTEPQQFADATGLIEIFAIFLDPTILRNVRDIINGIEWNSSLPAELTLQELASKQSFRELYNSFSNSEVAFNLIGVEDHWDFDASTEAIKQHPLIYTLFKDVVAVLDILHWKIMDVLRPLVPKMVLGTVIAGHLMPDHQFTPPPETSRVATAVLHDIGTRNDPSKAKEPDVDMFAKFPTLYALPIVLSLTEKLIQEIGLETVARAMEKDQQHVDSLPFAVLAMGASLVDLELRLLAGMEENNGQRIIDAPTYNRLTDSEKSVLMLHARVLQGYERQKLASPATYKIIAPIVQNFHAAHKFKDILKRV